MAFPSRSRAFRRNTWSVVAAALAVAVAAACSDDPTAPAAPATPEPSPLPDAAPPSTPPPALPDAAPPAEDAAPDAELPPCPVPEDATVAATLRVTTDDHFKVWVNGVLVDDAVRFWSQPQTYAVTLFRSPKKKNVLAIEGINAFNQGGLDRGVLADLVVAAPDGGAPDAGDGGAVFALVTDTTWKLSKTVAEGWTGLAFDDAAWVAPTDEGAHGISPWGAVFGASTARWIWSYDSATAVDKPQNESIHLRRGFWFDASGAVANAPGACR